MLLFDLFDDSCPYSWIKICTLTRDQLLYFVFRCFDEDNSGLLSHDEFLSMANAINEAGGGFFDGNFSQLIEKFDQNNDGNVDFGEFLMVRAFVRHEEKVEGDLRVLLLDPSSNDLLLLHSSQVDTFFPMAFFPVFRMQDSLQQRTLGMERWLNLIAKYDEGERRRCAERDVRKPFVPPRSFVERM